MVLVIFALVMMVCSGIVGSLPANATVGTNDYPSSLASPAKDAVVDPWGFSNRECVSFVAWRLNNDNGLAFRNNMIGGHYGNAVEWKQNAVNLYGASVYNSAPAAGSVAWWNANYHGASSLGHVAYVSSVNSDGSVVIEQYNAYPAVGGYSKTTVAPGSSSWPSGFIHLKDLQGTQGYSDGDYVRTPNGAVYKLVGGSAMWLDSWSSVGGVQAVKSIGQAAVDAMPRYPRNGTYVSSYQTSNVYQIVGGAPMKITSWASVGGEQSINAVVTDNMLFGQLRPYPEDGSFVSDYAQQKVYVVAGASLMRIDQWANVGGQKPVAVLDHWAVQNQFKQVPDNGTYIADYVTSNVYMVTGGAPMQIKNWQNVGGEHAVTVVDGWAVTNQLGKYPANGSYVTDYATSQVYVVAGSSLVRIDQWANVGGQKPVAVLDHWAVQNQFKPYPEAGTYVRGYGSGLTYVSDGTAIARSSANASSVSVDDWAVINQLGGTE